MRKNILKAGVTCLFQTPFKGHKYLVSNGASVKCRQRENFIKNRTLFLL